MKKIKLLIFILFFLLFGIQNCFSFDNSSFSGTFGDLKIDLEKNKVKIGNFPEFTIDLGGKEIINIIAYDGEKDTSGNRQYGGIFFLLGDNSLKGYNIDYQKIYKKDYNLIDNFKSFSTNFSDFCVNTPNGKYVLHQYGGNSASSLKCFSDYYNTPIENGVIYMDKKQYIIQKEKNLSCIKKLINYPYNNSFRYSQGDTIIRDLNNQDGNYYLFNYKKGLVENSVNLNNIENLTNFTGSLSNTGSSFIFDSLDSPLSSNPIIELNSDTGIKYFNITGTGTTFHQLNCDNTRQYYKTHLEYGKYYYLDIPLNKICLTFDSNFFTTNEISDIDFGTREIQFIETEICKNIDTGENIVNGEIFNGDINDIGLVKPNITINPNYKEDGSFFSDLLGINNNTSTGETLSFSGIGDGLNQNLSNYGNIVYINESLGSCKMFDDDLTFMYTVNNIYHLDIDLKNISSSSTIQTLLYIPDLLIGAIEKPFNGLFALLGSFGTIEDGRTYCYFGYAQKVEFQKYLGTGGVVIDELQDYKVEKGDFIFLDYLFLFVYGIIYLYFLFLLFKPKE